MKNKFKRLYPRAKLHLPVVLSLKFKEIKAVLDNISPNGALISSLSRISQKKLLGKTALIRYELPDCGTLEHCGPIIRGANNSYALRFNNLRDQENIKLWNYITKKLRDEKQCPYCGTQYEKKPATCGSCGWQLDFDSKDYIAYHKKMRIIKRLDEMVQARKIDQLEKIMNFIDSDILKNHEKPKMPKLVGTSRIMRNVFLKIKKVGPTNLNVLIEGKSGTGKEVTARAIHALSRRRTKPFVVINCPSIPENLIESELFGYEKGSFTGAYKSKKGKFEGANGGTILLDEIGDIPLLLQSKLLRFLEENVIEKIGTEEINGKKLDVRILAATSSDLHAAVEKGSFRKDLFYRLTPFVIQLPPVKDRGKDNVILAKYFLKKACKATNETKTFSDGALEAIKHYDWPGNVREIINTVGSAVTLSNRSRLTPEDLSLSYEKSKNAPETSEKLMTLEDAKQNAERDRLVQAIKDADHNITRVAKTLKLSRQTIYNLKKKYAI